MLGIAPRVIPLKERASQLKAIGRSIMLKWAQERGGRTLAEINGHPRDANISFEPVNHIYTIKGKDGHPISMTTLIHKYFEEFNPEQAVRLMMSGRKWKEGQSPHLDLAIEALGEVLFNQEPLIQTQLLQNSGPVTIKTPTFDLTETVPVEPYQPVQLSEADRSFFRSILLAPKWMSSPLYPAVSQGIAQRWSRDGKRKAQEGTDLHKLIEEFFNAQLEEIPDRLDFLLFLEWWIEFSTKYPQYQPFLTEAMIYDEDCMVSGSIDFCLIGPNGEIIIVDWKRSQEIKYSNNFTRGKSPLDHLDDCNYVHYVLQQNGYKYIQETKYDRRIVGLYLLILHPQQEHYQMISLPALQDEIKSIWPSPSSPSLPSPSSPSLSSPSSPSLSSSVPSSSG